MSHTIEISDNTMKNLKPLMRGHRSFDDLIDFLVVFYQHELGLEGFIEPSSSLSIKFEPDNDMEEFKRRLLKVKKAWIQLTKTDGVIVNKQWVVTRLTENSNIMNNLRSGPLRGWKEKGITEAIVSTEEFPWV
ncbi:hypothetical protein [Desulforhopalus sp. IMCC35007]|uniref:hypothetical protein n=1 Tax=Desulforhopalus sp. IMCC35007 TaxID=2569543 RepID=UPI0010ADB49B|nr:hypothetical protein [Desulforhopalus sp. IMCC35007]TKB05529.1 hypothetical protein FCL48_24530 [Desulforhopalus sp. IMCC35007]